MAEASLLSPPDPSKRRSTVSEWSEEAESHNSWTRNHDDAFALKLLRPWSIASHNSIRSRSSALNDTQYAASSAFEPDDASSRGLLSSGIWAKFARRSHEDSEDPTGLGAQFAYGGPGWWRHQMLADRSFRTMAALTSLFAFIMVIIVLTHSGELAHRANKSSTSVGGEAYVALNAVSITPMGDICVAISRAKMSRCYLVPTNILCVGARLVRAWKARTW
ncbi:MAG: hypothetical protein Q9181_007852 [Wetmoreana brouardii]